MVKVSVIMPVYNGEKFLEHTIESILCQSMQNFELILVDDGSKDTSGNICDQYAAKDCRVKVVHQKNKGICGARNKGLKIATGEYVAFADQDDDCFQGWLLDNYEAAKKFNADLVKSGRIAETVDENGTVLKRDVRKLECKIYNSEEIRENYFALRDKEVFSPVWDGLFRREIIEKNGLRFREEFKQGEEDTAFCLEFLIYVERLLTNTGIYFKHYERYATSTSSMFNAESLDGHIKCAVIEERVKKELGFEKWTVESVLSSAQHHLIPILLQLYHKNCHWSMKEKYEYVCSLHSYLAFQYDLNKEMLLRMWRRDKKKAIVVRVFSRNHNRTILIIARFYKYILNRKFRAMVQKK